LGVGRLTDFYSGGEAMKKSVKVTIALVAILAFTFSSWLWYSKYRLGRAVENRATPEAAVP
jgi:hypothetical protein